MTVMCAEGFSLPGDSEQRIPWIRVAWRNFEQQITVHIHQPRTPLRPFEITGTPRTDGQLCGEASVFQHPSVFTAAALRRVDDQRAFAQRHPRQSAGQHPRTRSHQDKGPQIDMAGFELQAVPITAGERRMERKLYYWVAQ